ncbi:MAG: hypothetical protein ACPG8W_13765 [Candidatus Promineifilaceae bacterium]
MNRQTWKGTRNQTSYFLSITPQEVICYTRDANDVAGELEIPDKNVSRCSHADFRAGELQDWAIVYMGDEVMMAALIYIYDNGTTADEARLNARTISHWQVLPFDLMLADDAKESDDDGFNHFAMDRDGATSAMLADGTTIFIPLNSTTGTVTEPDGTQHLVGVPAKTMSVIAYDKHFYVSGVHAQVISNKGSTTYSTTSDASRLQIGTLFRTGNLFRTGKRIILEFRADDTSTSDVLELTGRRGYLSLHPTRGIIAWQAAF